MLFIFIGQNKKGIFHCSFSFMIIISIKSLLNAQLSNL